METLLTSGLVLRVDSELFRLENMSDGVPDEELMEDLSKLSERDLKVLLGLYPKAIMFIDICSYSEDICWSVLEKSPTAIQYFSWTDDMVRYCLERDREGVLGVCPSFSQYVEC